MRLLLVLLLTLTLSTIVYAEDGPNTIAQRLIDAKPALKAKIRVIALTSFEREIYFQEQEFRTKLRLNAEAKIPNAEVRFKFLRNTLVDYWRGIEKSVKGGGYLFLLELVKPDEHRPHEFIYIKDGAIVWSTFGIELGDAVRERRS